MRLRNGCNQRSNHKKVGAPNNKSGHREREESFWREKKVATGFIACFCSSKDDSSYMWQHYAAGGTGHALVFDGKVLSLGAQGGNRYALFPVIYDEDVQVRKTAQIIERAEQLQNQWRISGEAALEKFWAEEVAYSLMVCGLRFKKPCFQDEQELRLFAWDKDDLKKEKVKGKTHIAMPFETSAIIRHIRGPNVR